MNIKPGNRVPGNPNEYTVGGIFCIFLYTFCKHIYLGGKDEDLQVFIFEKESELGKDKVPSGPLGIKVLITIFVRNEFLGFMII